MRLADFLTVRTVAYR